MGKDVEERIRGYLGVFRDARTSFKWHQIPLKRGPEQGKWWWWGGAEKN